MTRRPPTRPPRSPPRSATGARRTRPRTRTSSGRRATSTPRLGLTSQPRPADPSDAADASRRRRQRRSPRPAREEATMLDQEAVTATARPAPKKPSKLMADLSAAIRATAETAREQALAQVDADVAQVVEAVRSGSKEGEDALRIKSDGDVAGDQGVVARGDRADQGGDRQQDRRPQVAAGRRARGARGRDRGARRRGRGHGRRLPLGDGRLRQPARDRERPGAARHDGGVDARAAVARGARRPGRPRLVGAGARG